MGEWILKVEKWILNPWEWISELAKWILKLGEWILKRGGVNLQAWGLDLETWQGDRRNKQEKITCSWSKFRICCFLQSLRSALLLYTGILSRCEVLLEEEVF